MAEKPSKAELKRRQVKEVKTKLGNLSPTAAAEVMEVAVAQQARKQLSGFADFVREQGVVGVGIGLIFGIQIKAVVDTIMAKFVNPVTILIMPGGQSLSEKESTWRFAGEKAKIGWGEIVYSLLTFIIVAALIYAAYKLLRLERFKKKDK